MKRTNQIVADLLTSALEDFEKNLPEALGDFAYDEVDHVLAEKIGCNDGENGYYLGGTHGDLRRLANTHYLKLENEMGNDKPERLYGAQLAENNWPSSLNVARSLTLIVSFS